MSDKNYFLLPIIADYLDYIKNIRGLSYNTAQSYQRDLIKFSNFSESEGAENFEMLSEDLCSSWIANLFQADVSPRTIQRHISSAKGFFFVCKEE